MDPVELRSRSREARRRWTELRAAGGPPLLVVASFTAQQIEPGVGVTLADRLGVVPRIEFADHNQLFQVTLSPQNRGVTAGHDVVVLWRIEDVFERDFHAVVNGDDDAHQRLLDGAAALAAALRGMVEQTGCRLIVGDAPVPIGFGLDHDDEEELAALQALQRAVNDAFDGGLGRAPVTRLRLAALQAAYGTQPTFDRRGWLMYRQPLPDWFAHLVGVRAGELIAARTAATPKVLVLDCDGTLWEGIAGDDGIGALQAGDAFPGFAHQSFQRAAQRLRHRGVLLALASKNDPQTVVDAFAEVDGMVLTDADIAGRAVSWGPKTAGIAKLAEEFNVGLDSFVFVDDSDFELAAVEAALPDVRRLRVPDDIEELPDVLAESGLFRRLQVTTDDRQRTARIQAEARRSASSEAMSPEEFLASLALRVRVEEVAADGPLARITQLINKTNQFNLTTRRRSEEEVAALVASPEHRVFDLSVDDRFGEYGLVGVAIAAHGEDWMLDTLLMSCRVLGRGVETAFLAEVIDRLRAADDRAVVGVYMPTAKNGTVAGLYPAHGFAAAGEGRWRLAPGVRIEVPGYITIA